MAKRVVIRRLTSKMRGKLGITFLIIICLFLLLVIRLFYWNIKNGEKFSTQVLGQQEHSSVTIPYERGKIMDRNGNVLATNEKLYTLIIEPKNILSGSKDRQKDKLKATLDALHEYFDIDKDDLKSVIKKKKNSYYVVYKKNLSYQKVEAYKEFSKLASAKIDKEKDSEELKNKKKMAKLVSGVVFEESYKRVYPYNSLACHLLGFTSSGNVGNWGIEQAYNNTLNGIDGRSYYHFDEELTQEQSIIEAENGESVVSTIDIRIQRIIEDKLKEFDKTIGSNQTSIIVMNPNNGEILGMATSDPYNLNDPMDEKLLLSKFSQAEIDKMKKNAQEEEATASTETESTTEEEQEKKNDKKKKKKETIYDGFYQLWRNPIISNTYEPGSTYKPFTVSTGLESGILNGNESYDCTGSLLVGKRNIGCSHVHGHINLKEAVAKSCNVAMMNIVFNEKSKIFYSYQKSFGFGQKTGIDLPGEADTSTLVYNEKSGENTVTLATNAFGQNFNCTMIQLISGFASLINGGSYYKPHVVKEIQSDKGDVVEEKTKELVRYTVSEETSKMIRSYLQETVLSGTGTKAQIPGYSIGGKTGTAEKIPRNKEDYYISFIGFTPVEKPELLIYVTIDEPHVDNQANAGLAVGLEKVCMEEIVKVMGIKPTETIEEKSEGEEEPTYYLDYYTQN